jgi:MarR family transcriptional regulator, transcriptional regulator for hemolysin
MESGKPLGYLLGRSLRIFKNQMVSEFRKMGIELSFDHFVILHLLNSDCDLIQRDLASQMQKDKSIIVRHIDSLLENQFVVRLTNKEDKRKKNLILTKKGLDILNQMKDIASEVSGKLLTDVSPDDFVVFQKVLMKIQENGETEDDFFICGLNQTK